MCSFEQEISRQQEKKAKLKRKKIQFFHEIVKTGQPSWVKLKKKHSPKTKRPKRVFISCFTQHLAFATCIHNMLVGVG